MVHHRLPRRSFQFLRRCPSFIFVAGFMSLPAVHGRAQTPAPVAQMAKDATPQFEVAVIKPADPNNESYGFHTSGRQVFIENQSLSKLISFAYAVHQSQIVDAPSWVAHDRFDIRGVPDVPGYPDLKQYQMMVQKLLTDRFHLQFRRDQRELTVYAITVLKSGSKITKSAGDPDGLPDQTGYGKGGAQIMKFTNNTMSDLALCMQEYLDKPVLDNTGLKGRYDFTLTWTPDMTAVSDTSTAPGVFTAFQEQLGLKLQLTKEPTGVLVVERIERPSDN